MRDHLLLSAGVLALSLAMPAAAQSTLDRVDPVRVEERTPDAVRVDPERTATILAETLPVNPSGAAFNIGAIAIEGLVALPQAAFADLVEPYLGRTLGPAELAELVERLVARARQTYPLASASIEPQAVRAGVLRVRVDEGRIDEVRLSGVANTGVRRTLRSLASEQPVTTAQLERALLLAGDIDGITLGEARILKEQNRNILLVEVRERPFYAYLTVDNDSTKPLGPLELFGAARWNGVVGEADSLQLFGLVAVPHAAELVFGQVRYSRRISRAGTELSLTGSLSRTEPGAYLRSLDLLGDSYLVSAALSQPVWRSRRSSLWLEGSFAHRETQQDRAGELVRRDRLTTAELGWYGDAQLAGGRLRVSGEVTRGLSLLGATERGDPLASREDADGTFTAIGMFADWTRPISGAFGIRLAVRSQLADQPLLVAEEIGLGGASFARGYDYRERSGDEGAVGYGELHYAIMGVGGMNELEVYSFADGGEVSNLQNGFGGGSLFSTGAGLRADVDRRTDAGLEVAVPLSGERYDTDDKKPRVRLTVTRHF